MACAVKGKLWIHFENSCDVSTTWLTNVDSIRLSRQIARDFYVRLMHWHCNFPDGLSEHHARIKLSAAKITCMWSLFRISGHPRQWSASCWPFRWQAACWIHHSSSETVGATGELFLCVVSSTNPDYIFNYMVAFKNRQGLEWSWKKPVTERYICVSEILCNQMCHANGRCEVCGSPTQLDSIQLIYLA